MNMDGTTDLQRTPFARFLREVGGELAEERGRRVQPSPRSGADWRHLSTATVPIPKESLRGLVYRACAANDLPNSWGLLQYLGQQHRNRVLVSEDPNIDPAELAFAIGVADHEVYSRRYQLESGRLSFFGLELNPRSINTRDRRFSPVAFQRSGVRFHRALWELRDIPFCLEGWDMLQDMCGCERKGVVQGWTRTLTRIDECDRCGDPLHWMEPFEVPVAMRPALEVLAAILDIDSERRLDAAQLLPKDLRDANRSTMFDLTVRIANAIDPDAQYRHTELAGERLDALHQACVAISAWPSGIDQITWHTTTGDEALRKIKSCWFGLQPTSGERRAGSLVTGLTQSKPATVGIRRATEIAKLSPEVLLAAWEHGLLTKHRRVHGGRVLPAFDPSELRDLSLEWQDRVEPDAFAHSLGISYHGVEQMIALGVIVADARALPGTGPHFSSKNAARLIAKLTGPRLPPTNNMVPLSCAVTFIGGRPKPWGPILRALINGEMPFALQAATRPIDRIMIRCEDAPKVCAMSFDRTQYPDVSFSERMVQRDALELLNVSPAGGRLVRGLSTTGQNPKTFAVADVERRAAEIVSLPEVAAHMRTELSAAFKRLQDMHAREIIPGGWDRSILASLS